MDPILIRYQDVADQLSINIATVEQYVERGILRSIGTGHNRRIVASSLRDAVLPRPGDPVPTGFVYLIFCMGYYKIGCAKSVQRRMKQFQEFLPEEIKIIHTIPTNDMHFAEARLHQRFDSKRVRGEWFRLTPEDVAFICEQKAIFYSDDV